MIAPTHQVVNGSGKLDSRLARHTSRTLCHPFDGVTSSIIGLTLLGFGFHRGRSLGSPEDEEDRSEDEGPQTSVTLTKGFWMGKYGVTQGEYLAVMGDNPSYFNGDRTESGS
ncbi:MAG: SUMF1/EgtB/PvdO family nonheme iron enzyme [Verrucomicrobia bacterium]|nr:SUMF1/EgtB/PvdO family nonheme iron enzyme [Verrucomicrobiota bacterium]